MIDHISLGVDDVSEGAAFYGPVLETLGAKELARLDGLVAYGRERIELAILRPFDGGEASGGNGTHFAFVADSRDAVDAFHAAALAAGATDEGAPGPRPYPHREVYAAFVRDPWGNKLEALTDGFAA